MTILIEQYWAIFISFGEKNKIFSLKPLAAGNQHIHGKLQGLSTAFKISVLLQIFINTCQSLLQQEK